MSIRTRTSGIMTMVAPTPAPSVALDSVTVAWVAAVIANGGTVSSGRQTTVNNLIVSLRAGGLLTKLDRLWLFAAENEPSALTDLISDSLATAVNAPTFTVDRGYAGGTTQYIDTNVLLNGSGTNYVRDSAHISMWDNNSRTGAQPIATAVDDSALTAEVYLQLPGDVNSGAFNINTSIGGPLVSNAYGPAGHFLIDRHQSTTMEVYIDGGLDISQNKASVDISGQDNTLWLLGRHAWNDVLENPTPDQFSMTSIGGTLSGGSDMTNFYNALRTYMTAVGVP